jgi:hypothetical protein
MPAARGNFFCPFSGRQTMQIRQVPAAGHSAVAALKRGTSVALACQERLEDDGVLQRAERVVMPCRRRVALQSPGAILVFVEWMISCPMVRLPPSP